jgi:hypothetical protein
MKHLFFCLVGLYLFISCQSATDTTQISTYFNLKGFIETQIKELNKRKPLVKKRMSIDGASDSKEITDINWAKELELFLQADLNKQAYQLSYDISQPAPNTFLYTLKKGEKLPIKTLKVVVDEVSKQPKRIEVVQTEENKLYQSEKRLSLDCAMRPEGVWLLKTYDVSGFQHLSLSDKKSFQITGVVQ